MMKTMRNKRRNERERFRIPKSTRDIIPISNILDDGLFIVGKNKYSKTFKFTDINYAVASKEDKEALFLEYSELLNSFDSGASSKLTIINRKLSRPDFEENILMPLKGDGLDKYRREYNRMLLDKATEANAIVQDKYVTISVTKANVLEARSYFTRVSSELIAHFARLGSRCTVLNAVERLQIFRDFYRAEWKSELPIINPTVNHDNTQLVKDAVRAALAPSSIEFEKDCFKVGERYGRVLFLGDYASYIRDSIITELMESNSNMIISIDVIPVPTDEAVREVEKRLLGVETNITNWQRRQNSNNNFSAIIPYDMEQQRKEAREFLNDITTRDQRMMFAVMTVLITADTKEQLNNDTDAVITTARKHLCKLITLKYQQLDGINTALPYGICKIDAMRTLTTESLAVFMPFKVQEVMDDGGIYLGQNAISHNLILCNKQHLLNPNAFRLGVPGSGKSFGAKMEILLLALSTDDDILICDPENEYSALVKALKGEVIRIAAGSKDRINAMDMVEGYGESNDSTIDKSEFILSLFEQLDSNGLGSKEKSIIDRCTANVYRRYKKTGRMPTLITLREELLRQSEPEARELALALELFTRGSLDAFAHPTNVDTKNRIIAYNIMDLGKQLKTMGLLVITDAMINRVTENWRKGKRTHIILDEFHVVFENEYSGAFFNSAWRRFRKRNAYPTGITQNVEYLLDSVLASTMLSNSEFIVMHNQAASDREKLAKLLNISNEQMSYITNADEGCGLIKIGSALVPCVNKFDKNTELYGLMTTKPFESSLF